MSCNIKKSHLAAAAAVLATLLSPAAHADAVVNGSFDGNTLTGWTASGGTVYTRCDIAVSSICSAYMVSSNYQRTSLSQTLTTVAGAAYDYSFWIDNGAVSEISFTADGVEVYGLHNAPDSRGFLHVTGSFVAAGASTTIAFNLSAPGVSLYLDEVSVVAALPNATVPEPASLLLVGGALAGLGVSRRRAARVAG